MQQEQLAQQAADHAWFAVAPGVWGLKDLFVNVYMIHNARAKTWVLVDAGLKTSAPKIRRMAEELFWPESQPSAIVMTHGHFDHVGSLKALAEEWDVPVYAHELERPYLTGVCAYPPPDPLVGGGMMAYSSFLYPKGPVDVGERFQELPEDGTVPGLPGWQWIHTPGHTPGHISLLRKRDKVLIVGDAFVTTKQESLLAVARQSKILSGPPKYFTCDWDAAADSVRRLAALNPKIAATGHGKPMEGDELRDSLHELADYFEELAVPSRGRYVDDPAVTDENGIRYVPPYDPVYGRALAIVGIAASVALLVWWGSKPRQRAALSSLGAGATRLARKTAEKAPVPRRRTRVETLRHAAGEAVSDLIEKAEDLAAQSTQRLAKASEAALSNLGDKAGDLAAKAGKRLDHAGDAVSHLAEKTQDLATRSGQRLSKTGSRAADRAHDALESAKAAVPTSRQVKRRTSSLLDRLTSSNRTWWETALDFLEERVEQGRKAMV